MRALARIHNPTGTIDYRQGCQSKQQNFKIPQGLWIIGGDVNPRKRITPNNKAPKERRNILVLNTKLMLRYVYELVVFIILRPAGAWFCYFNLAWGKPHAYILARPFGR